MNSAPPLNKDSKKQRALLELADWVETILTALVCVILMFTFLFRIVVVEGRSMNNTLIENDYLILSDLGYEPKQGDIVVVQTDAYAAGKVPIIKRVIATEGQYVDINFDTWEVFVGDSLDSMQKLDEPYVKRAVGFPMLHEKLGREAYPMLIEENHIFLLGDNRNDSTDSRSFGPVPESSILGHAVFRILPFESIGIPD